MFFFFLGLAFTSVAHPQFFDEGAKIIEDHEGGSRSGEAPRDYIAFTKWYAGNKPIGIGKDRTTDACFENCTRRFLDATQVIVSKQGGGMR